MLQLFINSIIAGSIIALPAIAFTLMFSILKFANFAIGAYVTVGAFSILFFEQTVGMPIWAALIPGMMVTALVAWLSDVTVFKPLRNRSSITLLIVSIAVAFIIENVIRFIAGNDIRGFDVPLSRPIKAFGFKATPEQYYLVAISMVTMLAVFALLKYTRLGKAMRATADNFTLAQVRGINTNGIILSTWLIGGALAGLAGLLAGLDLVIEPLVGWNLTIPILAAAILGGIGSPVGAMIGAITIGFAEELTAHFFNPAYKVGVGFVVISILLLVRPQGLFGQPEIKK
jgi:branched-subunit amino acid ABC-type transport system permease component